MEPIAVVMMAKAPQAGDVKTRLCPPLALAEAAELYRCFLLDTIGNIRALEHISPVLAYTPEHRKGFFAQLAPDFLLLAQQGADLGARMATCFAQLFARNYTGIVLTGSDLPTLPSAYLRQAIGLIATPHIDVVLGPSEDGGYYLIGLRQLHGELFEGMRWSTAQVFAETMQRIAVKRLKVACLPPWYDIDTPADLARLRTTLARVENNSGSHTQRFVSSLAPFKGRHEG